LDYTSNYINNWHARFDIVIVMESAVPMMILGQA